MQTGIDPVVLPLDPVPELGEIQLRPWRVGDAEQLWGALAEPSLARWDSSLPPADLDVVRRWISQWQHGWTLGERASWAVATGADSADDSGDRVLGGVTLRQLDLAVQQYPVAHCAVGYWLIPAARGHRLAGRCARVAADWAARTRGIHRVELYHDVANEASCAVARSAGFELEGVTRASQRSATGWVDEHLHARVMPGR